MRRLAAIAVLAGLLTIGCRNSPAPSSSASNPPATPQGSTAGSAAHAGPPQSLADWSRGATIFAHLGTFHRKITTSSEDAQKYFDQGMRLLWAFNHNESTR